jgi:hypothetical protein
VRIVPATLSIVLCATLARAAPDDLLSPEAFEVLTAGRTITYSVDGAYYGTEQYLPGRRVIWTFGDICQKGSWAPQGDAICFTYDDSPEPSCWIFRQVPGGLAAWRDQMRIGAPLVSTFQSRAPMSCGPRVGV